ncbi:histidine phosphatase superfamily [Suillus discolor]|uniref:Histidine phosphatase superfamily n=1 Tax=Suillus discolor TaxID=1912936 RepID=A0A9P7K221_9AGAM|nr:histidine phosphatase superfamily [Suillus discolor]KAG2120757.1 histidine phosphatase superfamily [Suillus discolor]
MLSAVVLLLALPFCTADSASSYAGSTLVDSYPPPGATNAPAVNAYFPDGSQVGYAGPTPTGAEPAAIITAIPFSKVENAYPLSRPHSADGANTNFNVMRQWGNLAPMYSVESFGLPDASPIIPEGCGLNAVHLLMRHGARYPTSDSGSSHFASKIHAAASKEGFSVTGDLKFLATWTYKLGAEILNALRPRLAVRLFSFTILPLTLPFISFSNGVAFRYRYGNLLNAFTDLPVFRTTSEDRMVDSALNFAAGFFDIRTYKTDYHQEIIIEGVNFNNTLSPNHVCPNSNTADIGKFGGTQANKWANIYLKDAQMRLQPMIQGFNLTISRLADMQTLCAYETVALGYSKFCNLFTEEEWEGYEYYVDLSFWYGHGPGNPTAAAQGLGYVQELVSRLTHTPINVWNSSTNSTLDSSNITFPLNQPIYVDASHDTVISNIVTALNFTSLAATGPLPTDHIPPRRSYIASQIAPFASQLVAQVLSCPASEEPTHIRFVLNDGVVPLTGIRGCTDDSNGLCALPSFISGMHERIGQIDYAHDCFAKYTIPKPDNIIDGRYPR